VGGGWCWRGGGGRRWRERRARAGFGVAGFGVADSFNAATGAGNRGRDKDRIVGQGCYRVTEKREGKGMESGVSRSTPAHGVPVGGAKMVRAERSGFVCVQSKRGERMQAIDPVEFARSSSVEEGSEGGENARDVLQRKGAPVFAVAASNGSSKEVIILSFLRCSAPLVSACTANVFFETTKSSFLRHANIEFVSSA
jgi:hypothetical protein